MVQEQSLERFLGLAASATSLMGMLFPPQRVQVSHRVNHFVPGLLRASLLLWTANLMVCSTVLTGVAPITLEPHCLHRRVLFLLLMLPRRNLLDLLPTSPRKNLLDLLPTLPRRNLLDLAPLGIPHALVQLTALLMVSTTVLTGVAPILPPNLPRVPRAPRAFRDVLTWLKNASVWGECVVIQLVAMIIILF
jgi:hypothetical protein